MYDTNNSLFFQPLPVETSNPFQIGNDQLETPNDQNGWIVDAHKV